MKMPEVGAGLVLQGRQGAQVTGEKWRGGRSGVEEEKARERRAGPGHHQSSAGLLHAACDVRTTGEWGLRSSFRSTTPTALPGLGRPLRRASSA